MAALTVDARGAMIQCDLENCITKTLKCKFQTLRHSQVHSQTNPDGKWRRKILLPFSPGEQKLGERTSSDSLVSLSLFIHENGNQVH